MVSRIRGALTYANVVGSLALFIALGGVSYAAVKLPARSVGTKQLKTGSVTSDKIRNGTLRKRDFVDGVLPGAAAGADGVDGLPGANGAPGPKGEHGAQGPKGDAGPAGVAGPAGAAGADGHDGAAGHDGADGAEGPAGHDGTNGTNGTAGTAGPAGPTGPMGPAGVPGPAGSQGPTGMVTTARISGFITAIPAAETVWQFLGTQAVVATTGSQRLTASIMVPIATTGTPQTIKLDVCFQSNAGGPINPFSGAAFSFVGVTQTRVAQAVAGSVVPGAGTWRVGACTQTGVALDNNDFANGFVQVTN